MQGIKVLDEDDTLDDLNAILPDEPRKKLTKDELNDLGLTTRDRDRMLQPSQRNRLPQKKKTNKEMRFKELMQLTRKLKPHLSRAVMRAAEIVDSEEASHQNQLKASALIIATYKDLVKDLYDVRYDLDEAQEEVQGNTLFSLTMVNDPEEAKEIGYSDLTQEKG